ncbi:MULTISPECIES: hypothetical protein [unclassified Streptomyces]|uniref:hypothetical protein n=1 Tax=unclassified Streptomyces TaxID=2593676 RepID=UPI002365A453|nr:MULTISPECIES: hypothetical protein [unclassified Streptomyces]MDF3147536.1 hypothetical protein [Streptomyces sp. T21Q-yed]WDF36469.1 hypothetical protein PBV52_06630 [Streptomyces sp. T12]
MTETFARRLTGVAGIALMGAILSYWLLALGISTYRSGTRPVPARGGPCRCLRPTRP